ncbi:MAG: T9SS type A sorting domain-containing protein [Flavobacteriales bacterium]|nr:T9SS type A sorting domain-containing protein [Flavobacteriales bacterium]MCX7768185.1 T9SS type A sorting domain-containing protein [Flavobacteriales bacterium]MDW8409136.1 T9SS type A sorting domain-containing protein [Flavobacteriales bacterium]
MIHETCEQALPVSLGANYTDGPSTGNGCYYCDGANHADWFVFVPTSPGVVHVYSCYENADTRLWIYRTTTDCSNLELIAGFDDECPINLDPTAELYSTEGYFQACPGYTYYLEWDDMWDSSPFTFYFDFYPYTGTNVTVGRGVVSEYSHMPPTASGVRGYLTAFNTGNVDLTHLKARIKVSQGASPVLNQVEYAVPNLQVCGDPINHFTNYYPLTSPGVYSAELSLEVDETEDITLDNILTQTVVVDTVFARDSGGPFWDLPVDDPVILGHNFTLAFPDKLTSLSFRLGTDMFATPIPVGFKTRLYVYSTQPASGRPITPLDSTEDYFIGLEDTGWVTVPLRHGPLPLPSGTFFVGFRQFDFPHTLVWAVTPQYYYPGKNLWVKLDNVPFFLSVDSVLIGNNWDDGFALALRANFGEEPSVNLKGAFPAPDFSVFPNPSGTLVWLQPPPGYEVVHLTLLDASGRCVWSQSGISSTGGRIPLDVTPVDQGVYTLRIAGYSSNLDKMESRILQVKVVVAR